MAHSTPGAVAFVIECDGLVILHTGDFKLAKTAPLADRTRLEPFAEWGRRGVDVMLGDSTGAETPGVTAHEDDIIPGIEGRVRRGGRPGHRHLLLVVDSPHRAHRAGGRSGRAARSLSRAGGSWRT